MAPQLQLNSGPQDALLYDNTRSYFTNVGYVRTSNFQMELRDIDPQNTPSLGGTVNFVIPKAADLLGPCDLMVDFNKVQNPDAQSSTLQSNVAWGWVENVGMAMIDKITFSVGSHDVEVLTGDHLNIINELMRDDAHRYGYKQTLRTGRPLLRAQAAGSTYTQFIDTDNDAHDRIMLYKGGSGSAVVRNGKKLVIPLGLFFTKHPSAYFPIAAIAGVNDIRIQIKFKTKDELIMGHSAYPVVSGVVTHTNAPPLAGLNGLAFENGTAFARCQLRCHYVHVTGPEATSLMNREHVRLMKLWHGNEVSKMFTLSTHKGTPTDSDMVTWAIDLSFLHPVTEIVITIRKTSEMSSSTQTDTRINVRNNQKARTKNYFAYQGGKVDPNVEAYEHSVEETGSSTSTKQNRLEVKNFKLTLNGQSRHLDGAGVDRDYLMNRLMPLMHSNADDRFDHIYQTSMKMIPGGTPNTTQTEPSVDFHALSQLNDRKEIYCYPFSLAPESANPSGAVNFSKVSHARLELGVIGHAPGLSSGSTSSDDYQVDVYGVYYNWLAIKDGRAMTSFA